MQEKKKWYEKLSIFIGIIASFVTISGCPIYTLLNFFNEEGGRKIAYDNNIWLSVECASVFALNVNGEYVPVSYSPIEISDTMICKLVNEENTYEGIKENNYFKFYDVVPGEYEIVFLDSFFLYDKSIINISENMETKSVIHTAMLESYYSKYKISYNSLKNIHYEFRDEDCKYKIIDDIFLTDNKGTFNFLVNWDVNEPDVNIHTIDGGHVPVLIEEQYNGANFIN